jgi:signal transduction histidine kinase
MVYRSLLLFFVTLAYVLFRYSIHRKENKLKWKLKEQEQLIYEEKISFLINISHELRTPLTLIYAPLKRMLDKSNLEETVSPSDAKRQITLIPMTAFVKSVLYDKCLKKRMYKSFLIYLYKPL